MKQTAEKPIASNLIRRDLPAARSEQRPRPGKQRRAFHGVLGNKRIRRSARIVERSHIARKLCRGKLAQAVLPLDVYKRPG